MRIAGKLAVATLTVLGAGCGADAGGEPEHRSAILISIDTLRADRSSLYGAERDTTPGLEALARESIVFDHAYTVAPWTLIAHMSMLSGLYPVQHGVRTQEKALGPDRELLAETLGRAGYETYGLYFSGWIHPRHGFDRGFDLFEAHADVVEALANTEEVLDQRDPARPFFLFLHLFDVHSVPAVQSTRLAYSAPDEYLRRYLADAPDRFVDGDAKPLLEGRRQGTRAQLEAIGALYDGTLRYVDDRLAEAVDGWRAAGVLDEALLVVTADHGEALGTREGLMTNHGGFFQEGMRVPLLVRRPDGGRAGERVDTAVSLVDVAPTILAYCGVEPARPLPGLDLFGALPEDRLLIGQNQNLIALVRFPDKLITPDRPGGKGHRTRLDSDPSELDPISADADLPGFLALRKELFREFDRLSGTEAWEPSEPATAWRFSEGDLEALRQLGYAEEVERHSAADED